MNSIPYDNILRSEALTKDVEAFMAKRGLTVEDITIPSVYEPKRKPESKPRQHKRNPKPIEAAADSSPVGALELDRLAAWLYSSTTRRMALAEVLGVTSGAISNIMSGASSCSKRRFAKIEAAMVEVEKKEQVRW